MSMTVNENGKLYGNIPDTINRFIDLISQLRKGQMKVLLPKNFSKPIKNSDLGEYPEGSILVLEPDSMGENYLELCDIRIEEVSDGGRQITIIPGDGTGDNQFVNYIPENTNHDLMINFITTGKGLDIGQQFTQSSVYKGGEPVSSIILQLNKSLETILSAQEEVMKTTL